MPAFFLLLISLSSTAIGALTGIGGGVIIKPLLDAFSGLDISVISFLSGCTVLAMSCVSLLKSRSTGRIVNIKTSSLLAAGAAAGGLVGKNLFSFSLSITDSPNSVAVVQSIILAVITTGVFIYIINKKRIKTFNTNSSALRILIGFGLGMLSSFLGIGGGPINIMILSYFFSMDAKSCAINSIYIIFFSQITSLLTSAATLSIPVFPAEYLILMLTGGIAGGFTGSLISKKTSNRHIDVLFCILMLVIICICIFNIIRYSV